MTAVYDAFGRRVAWHTFVFVYDQSGRILEVSNRATSPVFFGDLVWVEGELLGRVENNVAVGMPAWVPPALGRRLPAPPGLWLLVVGGSGTLWLFALALRTRSPRWGTAGAALALVLVLGVACAPTGLAFYWVVTDYLGKPIAMTDTPTSGEAKVVWKASYAPFGSAVEDLDPDGDGTSIRMPIRFPGQWWDFTSGLHYNSLRDYDPAAARYLEADPIGQRGGINLFVYSGADPVNATDPSGACPWCVAGILAGGTDVLVQLAMNDWRTECVDLRQTLIATAAGAAGVGLLQRFSRVSTAFGGPGRPTYRFLKTAAGRIESHPIRRWWPNWASWTHGHLESLPGWHLPIVEPLTALFSAGSNTLRGKCEPCESTE